VGGKTVPRDLWEDSTMSGEIYLHLSGSVFAVGHPAHSTVMMIGGRQYAITGVSGSVSDIHPEGPFFQNVPLVRGTLTLHIVEIPRESPKPAKRRWSTSMGLRKPNG